MVAAVPSLAETGSTARSPDALAEVVVTAERRDEDIQKVPISITAIDRTMIENENLVTLKDLAREVPGLTVVSTGPGQNILIMRGISSTAGTTGTVGFYLDDTPIQASSNAAMLAGRGVIDPALFDLERVEVLRGPQGTLYGSSSMGGTIKYVTTQPDPARSYTKSATTLSDTDGGGANVEQIGVVNLPLSGWAALRLTAFYRHNDGFIDRHDVEPNDFPNINPAIVAHDINTENTTGMRGALRLNAGDGLVITPSLIFQETRLGGAFNFDSPQGNFGDLVQARDVAEPTTQKNWIGNMAVRKTYSSFELLSSTSYYDRDIQLVEDGSNVLYAFLSSSGQTSVVPAFVTGNYRNKEWTQEFRFTSRFQGPLQVTSGLFYHYVSAPLTSSIPTPPNYEADFGLPFGPLLYSGGRNATLREYAGYGEASYELPWSFKLTGGLRVFEVRQTIHQESDGPLVGGYSEDDSASDDHGVNPKFTVSNDINSNTMVYATASKGYRPGGPNNPAPEAVCGPSLAPLGLSQSELTKYKSDSLWNYELGAKTRWLDGRLTMNAAEYYIKWTDVQQQLVLPSCGFNITANFGAATSKGGELEIMAAPARGVTLGLSGGYTDATLNNAIPGTGAEKGDNLLDVPKWTAAASAEYQWPVAAGLSGLARVDYTDRGGANALFDRTSPWYHYDGFPLTNLRVGLRQTDGKWQLSLFTSNVFNKIGETALPVATFADLSNTRRIAVNTPRAIGARFDLQF
jgi:outer membrane receptor protein involved in Fe transport